MSVSITKDQKVLVDSFYKIKTKKNWNLFISGLFTEEEILDLAQRVKIAQLILNGKTYEEIEKLIPVSSSTISKIGQIIKYGKGGFSLLQNSTKAKK